MATVTAASQIKSFDKKAYVFDWGSDIVINVETQNVADGADLYWSIGPQYGVPLAKDDFDATSGTVKVFGNKAKVVIKTGTTLQMTRIFNLRITSYYLEVKMVDSRFKVTSNLPESKTINEGDSVIYTVNCTKFDSIPLSSLVFKLVTSKATYASDMSITIEESTGNISQSFAAGFKINNNPFDIILKPKKDVTTEGDINYKLKAYNWGASIPYAGALLYEFEEFSVVDTSVSCAVVVSPKTIKEGETVKYTIERVSPTALNTKVYWRLVKATGNAETYDFVDGTALSGVAILDKAGVKTGVDVFANGYSKPYAYTELSFTTAADRKKDGDCNYYLFLYDDESYSQDAYLTKSVPCVVLDTSRPASYTIKLSKVSVNEDDKISVNVATLDTTEGATVWWRILPSEGVTLTNDDFVAQYGSCTIKSNSFAFEIVTKADLKADGQKTFKIGLFETENSQEPVVLSSLITVNDTSMPPAKCTVTSNVTETDEGKEIVFDLTTEYISDGQVLYWRLDGTNITASDFVAKTGTVKIQNSKGSLKCMVANDKATEDGDEYATLCVFLDKYITQIGASSDIKIKDTSISWAVTFDKLSFDEGQILYLTVNATNTIPSTTLQENRVYWKIVGTNVDANDIATISGSLKVTSANQVFRIPISATNDYSTEGLEKFKFVLYKDANMTQAIMESAEISINDTSAQVSCNVNQDVTELDESKTVTIDVQTAGLPNGKVLYTKLTSTYGKVTQFDFESFPNLTISSNKGRLALTVREDVSTEGEERFRVDFYIDSEYKHLIGSSQIITINDTSRQPPISADTKVYVTAPVKYINEGSEIQFTITSALPDGTRFSIAAGPSAENIIANNGTGSTENVELLSTTPFENGKMYANFRVRDDRRTEGTQTFVVYAVTYNWGQFEGFSEPVTIMDTSINTADVDKPTAIISAPTAVREGSTIVFRITTKKVPDDSIVNWELKSSIYLNSSFNQTASASDVVPIRGTSIIKSNFATATAVLTSDQKTEGDEGIVLYADIVDFEGNLITTGQSPVVTVLDTSKGIRYSITPNKPQIGEGETLIFTVTTEDKDGTQLFWLIEKISSSLNDSDFFDNAAFSGVGVVSSGKFNVHLPIRLDKQTDGIEYLRLKLYNDERLLETSKVAESIQVAILDTSVSPALTVKSAKIKINEGESIRFDIVTTNIDNGQFVYWKVNALSGLVNSSDFAVEGKIEVLDNKCYLELIPLEDVQFEGVEKFSVSFYGKADMLNVLATSQAITIVDTSVPQLTCSVTSSVSEVNEGDELIFYVSTNAPLNTHLYWKLIGSNVTSTDITGTSFGDLYTKSDKFLVSRKITLDKRSEDFEYVKFVLYSDSARANVIGESNVVKIADTSTSFGFASGNRLVKEGDLVYVVFSVENTTYWNGASNTFVYWKLESSTGVDYSDVSKTTSLRGSFQVKNTISNTFKIPLQFIVDSTNDVDDKFRILLYTDENMSTLVAASEEYTVSNIEAKLVYVSADKYTVNEGELITFTVDAPNDSDGTMLYPIVNEVGVDPNKVSNIKSTDFSGEVDTQNKLNPITIFSGKANFSIRASKDLQTEASEAFILYLSRNIDYSVDETSPRTEKITILANAS